MEHDDVADFGRTPVGRLISEAVKSRPEFELRKMLSLHKSESLKKLARTYKMKRYASSKKSEMVDYLCTEMADHAFVESFLLHTNDEEYAFFESAAIAGGAEMCESEAAGKPYSLFRHLYFLDIYYTSGRITFVVPEVIREMFLNLKSTSFPSTRKRYNTINLFATAFTSLYGLVDFDFFIDLCNDQLQVKMDYTELANILIEFSWVRKPCYCVFGDLLIHSKIGEHTVETVVDEYMVEESNDEVNRIETARDTIPMKHLPLEEVLMYANPSCFEHTPAHDRLIHFLETHDSELSQYPVLLQYVLSNLNETFMSNDDTDFELPVIDMRKYATDSDTMRIYNDLMRDVERHTRKWSQNGWMIAEIESQR